MYNYHVMNQWGGNAAPWNEGGLFVIGGRSNQACVAVNIQSTDKGNTFTGTITYAGEGPIGFKANLVCGDTYAVQNQWGGNAAPWNPGGHWVIGARSGQHCVGLHVTSADNGLSLTGTMTYAGEGPIGFKATQLTTHHLNVQNQWGGNSAPWHDGGTWVLTSRSAQQVEMINITSADGGKTSLTEPCNTPAKDLLAQDAPTLWAILILSQINGVAIPHRGTRQDCGLLAGAITRQLLVLMFMPAALLLPAQIPMPAKGPSAFKVQ